MITLAQSISCSRTSRDNVSPQPELFPLVMTSFRNLWSPLLWWRHSAASTLLLWWRQSCAHCNLCSLVSSCDDVTAIRHLCSILPRNGWRQTLFLTLGAACFVTVRRNCVSTDVCKPPRLGVAKDCLTVILYSLVSRSFLILRVVCSVNCSYRDRASWRVVSVYNRK